MGIGYSRPVKLVQLVTAKAATGNWTQPTNGEVFETFAEISNPSGFRDYQNGQTQMGLTKRFKIRFRFDRYPNCEWKIVYQGKDWTVSSIQRVDEKQFYWTITAQSKGDV